MKKKKGKAKRRFAGKAVLGMDSIAAARPMVLDHGEPSWGLQRKHCVMLRLREFTEGAATLS